MRRGVGLLCLLAMMATGAVAAQELTSSPRPLARPGAAPAATPSPEGPDRTVRPAPPAVAEGALLRPRPRPGNAAAGLPPSPPSLAAAVPTIRPMPRPASLSAQVQTASAAAPASARPAAREEGRGGLFGGLFGRRKDREEQAVPADGFVCGDRRIRGEELAPITSRVRGCGVEEPVRVTSVDGIRLSTPATIDCTTARALKTWIDEAMRPAFGRNEVVELRIAASYICRPRNNVRGAKISEHGRGKAIDISGFIMADGREWSIAGDYNRTIRRAHKAACGIFGTTLGPGSDGYHEDHLHFDTANMDRPYCR